MSDGGMSEQPMSPDAAAQLQLIRAEIAALREQVTRPALPRHAWFPGFDAHGHLVLPERHHWLAGKIRAWLHVRAHAGPQPHTRISRQRRMAIWLTATSAARVIIWVVAMILIILHWTGVTGPVVSWFATLSGTVIFITFISLYCNAATDGASLTAAVAALFSADSHAAAVAAGASMIADLGSLEGDIARLADLSPGAEAAALAASIRGKLTAPGPG
jgi:hypothetical protein